MAEAIRADVFSGRLVEGQRLPPERELAEQFGVSRVVVREAIRALELSGILKVRKGAGGGTFVSSRYEKPLGTSISNLLAGGAISLDHLFEMRMLLEPPAAELAAKRASDQQLAELKEIVSRAQGLRTDSKALRQANLAFHRKLVEMAGNPLLAALCGTVLDILVRSLEGKLSIETSLAVLGYHEKIVTALEARDGELARELTVGDLQQLAKRYKQLGIEVPAPAAGHPGRA